MPTRGQLVNTLSNNPTHRLVVVDDELIKRANQRRRISAAFVWSRVDTRYPGDQVIPDTVPGAASAADPNLPAAADEETPRHQLGDGPDMVDIRTLVRVNDDPSSTGRHAALDPEVLRQLEAAGAR